MSENHIRLQMVGIVVILALMNSPFSSAQSDPIYFNKRWVECDKINAKFYRLYDVQDSIVKVEHYTINDHLLSSGCVLNSTKTIQKLNLIGELDDVYLGEWNHYKKRGKLSYKVNHTPFDKTFGVGSETINLLDSMDTIDLDIQKLSFYTSYFTSRIEYGFLWDHEEYYGNWTKEISKSRKVVVKAHNYDNELNGLKIEYYRTGIIRRESIYKDDALHGEKKRYNRKGILVEGKVYEDGELIETWRYHKPKK